MILSSCYDWPGTASMKCNDILIRFLCARTATRYVDLTLDMILDILDIVPNDTKPLI